MNDINLEEVETIYFIGIGGIAMSATACIAKEAEFDVFGSDEGVYSPASSVLKENDIDYEEGYKEETIKNIDPDLIIASAAQNSSNPEIAWAEKEGKEIVSLPQFLKALFDQKIRIVVAGTHGKSTTAGALGHLLSKIEDSSFMVGGVLAEGVEKQPDYKPTNFKLGEGNYFVCEGDEYKSTYEDPTPKFHYLKPDVLVLTNLEFDHPDVFSSREELEDEFSHLIEGLPEDGLVIYNGDDGRLKALAHSAATHTFSFGWSPDCDFKIESKSIENGGSRISLQVKLNNQTRPESYWTPLFGEAYIMDVLGAIAALRVLGFSPELINHNLSTYFGIKRRLELVGEFQGAKVYDDYAHHPTAVRATLEALKETFTDQRIIAVFEPHTFSRTESLLGDYASAFDQADQVLIAPIYPAREVKREDSISSEKLVKAIQLNQESGIMNYGRIHDSIKLLNSKDEALMILRNETKLGDIIVIMAVGDFHELAYELIESSNK